MLMLAVALFPASQSLAADWQQGDGYRFMPVDPGSTGGQAKTEHAGFTLLGPSATGVRFTNTLSAKLMMENNNFMNGSGVAAGDFDGDGRCDLYFCAINGTNTLYRNLGNWRFVDVTASAGVGCANLHSTGALFADLDGDGRLDLLVSTLGTGVHCFMNQGGGRFKENTDAAGVRSQTGSTSLAMADVDGDGALDLYVANYGARSIVRGGGRADVKLVNGQWVVTGPYAQRLKYIDGRLEEVGEPDVLYLNDGTGHFKSVPWNSEYFLDEDGKPMPEPWDYGLTVQMRDLNGDGFPDIYVCNDFQTVDRIWLNDGTGHFRALPRLAMRKQSFSSMGVDFADIDRDGYLDFFTTEMTPRDHRRRMREVVGLQPLTPVPGRIDNRPEVARNTLFHNRGDGTYAEIANFSSVAASDWTWQGVFLDVDLDGYEDILIGNGMPFDVQDRDTLARIRSLGKQTPEQSRTNLLLYPPYLSPNVAYRNRGDLTFEDVSSAWGFNSTQISQGIALADLDGDGDLDLVINSLNGPALLYRNDSPAPRVAVRLRGSPPNRAGIGALVRVLGGPVPVQMQEVICGGHYLSCDEPLRVFAAGSPTNRLTIEVTWRSGQHSEIKDVSPNRIYELDQASAAPAPAKATSPERRTLFRDVSDLLEHTHHEVLFNDYLRQPLLMKQLSQLGPAVAWVDLDGDGHDELVIGSGKGAMVSAFTRSAAGRFVRMATNNTPVLPDDSAGMAAWSSADGRQALLVGLSHYESDRTNLPPLLQLKLIGTPPGPELAPLPQVEPIPTSPGPLAVADLDGDGQLEVFLGGRVIPGAYPQAASSVIYRQDHGHLVPDRDNTKALAGVGLVSGAVWSDLDGDGFPELILACEWGPVRVFKNERGHLRETTAELGLGSLTGWWNGVTTGDLDEDGSPDIIASNWGLNDTYQASPERPLRLYFGDLAGRGVVDLLEAYYPPELSVEVPRRSFNALSQAFPFLIEHFPTHAAFSTASIPDLLRLIPRAPQVVAANTLANLVFLNRGDHFQPVPLPTEAQLAPAFAVNVADVDGDGHEDVFLSQNFYDVRPEWPRLDGGRALWLRGNGKGQLTPIPGQDSGVLVYGEQRGAAVGDFNEDGRVDLVVTQNGAATRLFENVQGRPGLRVRLLGPPGNPYGIGALVRLQFGQRLGPAREIHGGSGYWSQDSLIPVLATPQPPERIFVRWPGGRQVAGEVPQGCRAISVDTEGDVRRIK
jgi:hypothetical protein